MECTCGSTDKPWPELKLFIPACACEADARKLVAVLAEVNGVRGVQVNVPEKQVTVSYNSDLVTDLLLQEIIERTGYPITSE